MSESVGTCRHAEQQIRQNKNTWYDLRSQKLQPLCENGAVHICDGKSWLKTAQVSKHIALYNCACVTSLRCVLWRTRWLFHAQQAGDTGPWTGATEGKKLPGTAMNRLCDRTEQEQLKLIDEKKESCWSLSTGGQWNPSLKGVTVQSCVCTPLEMATCHAKRAMPSSLWVHAPSAIRNYPVITGWCCSLPLGEFLIVIAVSALRKWCFLLFLCSLPCAIGIERKPQIFCWILLDTVASLVYLTIALFPSLLFHCPLKKERGFSGLSWRMNCQLVNSVRLAYSLG